MKTYHVAVVAGIGSIFGAVVCLLLTTKAPVEYQDYLLAGRIESLREANAEKSFVSLPNAIISLGGDKQNKDSKRKEMNLDEPTKTEYDRESLSREVEPEEAVSDEANSLALLFSKEEVVAALGRKKIRVLHSIQSELTKESIEAIVDDVTVGFITVAECFDRHSQQYLDEPSLRVLMEREQNALVLDLLADLHNAIDSGKADVTATLLSKKNSAFKFFSNGFVDRYSKFRFYVSGTSSLLSISFDKSAVSELAWNAAVEATKKCFESIR